MSVDRYLHNPSHSPELFDLFAVIVHIGTSIVLDWRNMFVSRILKLLCTCHLYVAVLNYVSIAGALDAGHYICFVRKSDDWFRCDDAMITRVSVRDVLACQAYVLFEWLIIAERK